jgi:simple sugar transport system substrate-binding protein
MIRFNRKAAVLASAVLAFGLAACSSSGGKETTTTSAGNAGKANTPRMTVAMITHASPGDTFWNIIRNGAQAAAAKDNVDLQYSNNDDPAQQAQLIQAAIDKKVDGIAVTDPNTGALGATIKKAIAAGIPVTMFNAGGKDGFAAIQPLGYFGQDESEAGQAAGAKMAQAGAKNILCVIQTQGQSQLEARCDGVIKGASGAKVQRLYVNGTDDSAVTTGIQAKLTQDTAIDYVITLGAPIALDAVKSVKGANSKAKIVTFDTNKELVAAVKSGDVQWAIDQQPYLQGYLAVDALWLYKTNANVIGGGGTVPTGPSFVDSSNVAKVSEYAAKGNR